MACDIFSELQFPRTDDPIEQQQQHFICIPNYKMPLHIEKRKKKVAKSINLQFLCLLIHFLMQKLRKWSNLIFYKWKRQCYLREIQF